MMGHLFSTAKYFPVLFKNLKAFISQTELQNTNRGRPRILVTDSDLPPSILTPTQLT